MRLGSLDVGVELAEGCFCCARLCRDRQNRLSTETYNMLNQIQCVHKVPNPLFYN